MSRPMSGYVVFNQYLLMFMIPSNYINSQYSNWVSAKLLPILQRFLGWKHVQKSLCGFSVLHHIVFWECLCTDRWNQVFSLSTSASIPFSATKFWTYWQYWTILVWQTGFSTLIYVLYVEMIFYFFCSMTTS